LVERLAEAQRDAQGGACLAGAGWTVEVEDAATLLRLDAAQVPDAVQIGADLQRSQASVDVGLHLRMQDHLVEVMTGLRLHQHPHIRGWLLFIAIPPSAARVAVVIGSGCIRRQFDFRGLGDGACGHGGSGFLGLGY
jgi:hypothetical protein